MLASGGGYSYGQPLQGQLTTTRVSGPQHGTLTLNADGSFVYTPNPGYVGADSFTYQDADGPAVSNIAAVLIQVSAPSSPAANQAAFVATDRVTEGSWQGVYGSQGFDLRRIPVATTPRCRPAIPCL